MGSKAWGCIALVAMGLVAAGCGSDKKPDAQSTTATSTTTVARSPEDKRLAQSVVLRLADLPTGWTASDDDDDDDTVDKECPEYRNLLKSTAGGFQESPDFEDDSNNSVTGGAAVYPDEATAEAALKRYSDPKVRSCLSGAIQKILKKLGRDEGLKTGDTSSGVQRVAVDADGTYAMRFSTEVESNGINTSIVYVISAARSDKIIQALLVGGVGSADQELTDDLMSKLVDRAERAQANQAQEAVTPEGTTDSPTQAAAGAGCTFGTYGAQGNGTEVSELRMTSSQSKIDGYAPPCLVADSVADRALAGETSFNVSGARWDGGNYTCTSTGSGDFSCEHKDGKYTATVTFSVAS